MPGAVEEANAFLAQSQESLVRLQRVSDLIEGLETPYGMELLSSVHWVAWHGMPPVTDATGAVVAVHNWNERKRSMFKPGHITIAWQRLQEQGWLA